VLICVGRGRLPEVHACAVSMLLLHVPCSEGALLTLHLALDFERYSLVGHSDGVGEEAFHSRVCWYECALRNQSPVATWDDTALHIPMQARDVMVIEGDEPHPQPYARRNREPLATTMTDPCTAGSTPQRARPWAPGGASFRTSKHSHEVEKRRKGVWCWLFGRIKGE
jgi:hypothetical protein